MVPICALMGACFSYGFSSSRENNGISDGDDDGDGDGDGACDGDGDSDGDGDGGISPPCFFLNFCLDAWDGGSIGENSEGDGAE